MTIVNSMPSGAFSGPGVAPQGPSCLRVFHRAVPPSGQAGRIGLPISEAPSTRDSLLASIPSLRAFAISLCRNVDHADDLVQEALLRALSHIDSFQPGTNMAAWLFTILRNALRSEHRKRWREVEDTDGSYADMLESQPEQASHMEFLDFRTALAKLPIDQREALILIGASGYTYGEAAKICDCPIGTIKSRVNRARIRLAQLLSVPIPTNQR
jgi:RNA polymerase sigma-70 factor, ECF subfamily